MATLVAELEIGVAPYFSPSVNLPQGNWRRVYSFFLYSVYSAIAQAAFWKRCQDSLGEVLRPNRTRAQDDHN